MKIIATAVAAAVLTFGPATAASTLDPDLPDGSSETGHRRQKTEPPVTDSWLHSWLRQQQHDATQALRDAPPLDTSAAAIAACESGHRLEDGTATIGTHDWTAQNPHSSASGAFQFIDGTWDWVWQDLIGTGAPTATAAEATPLQQLYAFRALWNDGDGSRHWDASASCWRPMLTDNNT